MRDRTVRGRTDREGHAPHGTKYRNEGMDSNREKETEVEGNGEEGDREMQREKNRGQGTRSRERPVTQRQARIRRRTEVPRVAEGPGTRLADTPRSCCLITLTVASCTNTGIVGQTTLDGLWAVISFVWQMLPCGETPPLNNSTFSLLPHPPPRPAPPRSLLATWGPCELGIPGWGRGCRTPISPKSGKINWSSAFFLVFLFLSFFFSCFPITANPIAHPRHFFFF